MAKRVSGQGDEKATLIDVVEGRVPMADFVDSLDEEVLYRLVAGAADEVPHEAPKRTDRTYKEVGGARSSGSTTALYVDSLGIPDWKMTDGPAGCHLPFMAVTGYPVGMVGAQTWRFHQAFCNKQSGGRPDEGEQYGDRTCPARNLSARF